MLDCLLDCYKSSSVSNHLYLKWLEVIESVFLVIMSQN